MIKEIKNKLLAALRSGEFKQGSGVLKDERNYSTEYCCLGVLRHIMNPDDTSSAPNALSPNRIPNGGTYLSHTQLAACGLGHDEQKDLAEMNDHGKSFLEIAQYIEYNISGT